MRRSRVAVSRSIQVAKGRSVARSRAASQVVPTRVGDKPRWEVWLGRYDPKSVAGSTMSRSQWGQKPHVAFKDK